MTRDRSRLEAAWENNAAKTAGLLRSGRSAAFLTLGDPMTYSTFGYLMRTLRAMDASLPVEVVPGIASYQEAAARTRTVLCEGEENLLLMSGINNAGRLRQLLGIADSAVILKAYRNLPAIRGALAE
jgi:precorrin-2/cobalt-factor-2 C20-methyltransferase